MVRACRSILAAAAAIVCCSHAGNASPLHHAAAWLAHSEEGAGVRGEGGTEFRPAQHLNAVRAASRALGMAQPAKALHEHDDRSHMVSFGGASFTRGELRSNPQLRALLGKGVAQAALAAPAVNTMQVQWDGQGHAAAATRRLSTPASGFAGDSECGWVGRNLTVPILQDVCAAVPVTPAQRDTIEAAVTTVNDANVDATTRAAAETLLLAVPGVADGVVGAIPANTALPAGLNLTAVLTAEQSAALLDATNSTSLSNITTFGQLTTIVGTPGLNATNASLTAIELLQDLPVNATELLLGAVTCDQTNGTSTSCVCPVDFTGPACRTPRTWACSAQWSDEDLAACLDSNAASPGVDLTSPLRVPRSRTGPLGYSPRRAGAPPCAFFSTSAPALRLGVATTCALTDPPPITCNGSLVDVALLGGQGAVDALDPATAPFFGLRCLEATLPYALGGPGAVDWAAALAGTNLSTALPLSAPLGLTLLPGGVSPTQGVTVDQALTPVDFLRLSDASGGSNATLGLSGLVAAAAALGGATPQGRAVRVGDREVEVGYVRGTGGLSFDTSVALDPASLTPRFRPGGRVVLYTHTTTNAGSGGEVLAPDGGAVALPPFTASSAPALTLDEVSYSEPDAPPPDLLVPILVPLLLLVVAVVGGVVWWRWRSAKEAEEQARLEKEGFGMFSGDRDTAATLRKQAAGRGGAGKGGAGGVPDGKARG